ncbi:hypothetical protein MHYP_G00359160 [Metynnis hypsauchen]
MPGGTSYRPLQTLERKPRFGSFRSTADHFCFGKDKDVPSAKSVGCNLMQWFHSSGKVTLHFVVLNMLEFEERCPYRSASV